MCELTKNITLNKIIEGTGKSGEISKEFSMTLFLGPTNKLCICNFGNKQQSLFFQGKTHMFTE
jgi:hypothetical protein